MAITFDLNTTVPFTDQALWDMDAPFDSVMAIAALAGVPDEPTSTPPQPQRVEHTTRDADDSDAITWEDAEWQ